MRSIIAEYINSSNPWKEKGSQFSFKKRSISGWLYDIMFYFAQPELNEVTKQSLEYNKEKESSSDQPEQVIYKYIIYERNIKRIPKVIESKISKLGELEDNWDGYGAGPIDHQTRETTTDFIALLSSKVFREKGILLDNALITPCGDGGIDCEFHNTEFTLLINIPKQPNPVFSMFLQRGEVKIEMEFNSEENIDGILFMFLQMF
jgi:hypothetical protein